MLTFFYGLVACFFALLAIPIVLTFLLPAGQCRTGKEWRRRIMYGWDQLANTWFRGNEDETISSRVGRGAVAGKWRYLALEKLIDFVFFFITGQKSHCRESIGK